MPNNDEREPKLKPGQYYGVDNDVFHGDTAAIDKQMRELLEQSKTSVQPETGISAMKETHEEFLTRWRKTFTIEG
jgi:hypothetical protein